MTLGPALDVVAPPANPAALGRVRQRSNQSRSDGMLISARRPTASNATVTAVSGPSRPTTIEPGQMITSGSRGHISRNAPSSAYASPSSEEYSTRHLPPAPIHLTQHNRRFAKRTTTRPGRVPATSGIPACAARQKRARSLPVARDRTRRHSPRHTSVVAVTPA
jgi:hypothetical protein